MFLYFKVNPYALHISLAAQPTCMPAKHAGTVKVQQISLGAVDVYLKFEFCKDSRPLEKKKDFLWFGLKHRLLRNVFDQKTRSPKYVFGKLFFYKISQFNSNNNATTKDFNNNNNNSNNNNNNNNN